MRFEKDFDHWVVWERKDGKIRLVAQRKANWPGHLVVEQLHEAKASYNDYYLYACMSVVAAATQKGIEELGLAPHVNLHCNANWAFRNQDGSYRDIEEGRKQRGLHIHVYPRWNDIKKDSYWGEPMVPANHKQQQEGLYWGRHFSPKELEELAKFLSQEIPRALINLERS